MLGPFITRELQKLQKMATISPSALQPILGRGWRVMFNALPPLPCHGDF
jgi:hypothetical protein